MKRFLVVACLIALLSSLAIVDVPYAAGGTRAAAVTRHCGSLKYGADGLPPGPSEIIAKDVSCRFARALALRGGAHGWHCHLAIGLTFVCKPVRGRGAVTFFGE